MASTRDKPLSLSMLRYYIGCGAQKVVGGGKGQPEGRWEWKQDDVRAVPVPLWLLLLDKDCKRKYEPKCAMQIIQCSILLRQAKLVTRELLNWKWKAIKVNSSLFPPQISLSKVKLHHLCGLSGQGWPLTVVEGLKNLENCIITTSMDPKLLCAWFKCSLWSAWRI